VIVPVLSSFSMRPVSRLTTFVAVALSLTAPLHSGGAQVAPSAARTGTPASAAAQAPRTVEGRVRRPMGEQGDSTGMGPAANVWVTLHRVGSDTAGAIDSTRSDAAGRYRFRYVPRGAGDAVYFASSTWDGIAYFTAPLRSANARDDAAEITVFDTTSRTFPLTVKGRHLIVSRPDSTDRRTIVEVFELSNDSLKALVSVDTTTLRPTWSVSIPATAMDVRVNDGDISPNAFVASNGRASVYSPIAPGIKQVAFTYKLPNSSFPLALTSEDGAVVFEVLLEEPQGSVSGQGFTAVEPVSLEGRNFKRSLAQDLKPDTRIVIELPSTGTPGRNLYIAALLAAIGFMMLLVLSRSMQRTASKRAGAAITPSLRPRESEAPLADRLAQEIAALDATYARQQEPSASVQQAYTTRRAELRAALAAELGQPFDSSESK